MTRYLVPPLRRCVQAISLLVLVMLPLLALYSHYKEARAIVDLPADHWQSTIVRGIDEVVGDDPRRAEAIANTQGTMWSARLCGVSLTDPLAGLEAIVSSRTVYRPLMWSLLIPVLVTLVLGRVFCGWICPMNTLLEILDRGRRLLRWLEIPERDVRFWLGNKYIVLALALSVVAVTGIPLLAMIYPPAVLSREMHLLAFGGGIGVGAYLVLAICAFELFVSKRWWCRYICPGGAVYSLLGRFRVVRVHRNKNKCTQCGDCVRACQFGLRPMLVTNTPMECTNCAACIAGCDYHALGYRFVLPVGIAKGDQADGEPNSPNQLSRNGESGTGHRSFAQEEPVHGDSRPVRCSSGSAERLMLLGLAVVLLAPSPAMAHHILGLPHYSYKENYPQAPTLEYPATTGPYDVLMTSYPGKPVPGEAATIAFYIKDRTTGQPLDQVVTVQVLKTSTFGGNKVIYPPATHTPFDNQHKYTITFPEDHEYIVELSLDVEGQTEVIPFLIVAGQPTATRSILIVIGFGLALFLLVVRAIKVKRDRRQRVAATGNTTSNSESSPVRRSSEGVEHSDLGSAVSHYRAGRAS